MRRLALVVASTFLSSIPLAQLRADDVPVGFLPLLSENSFDGWCGRGHVNPIEFRDLPEANKYNRQAEANENLSKHWRIKHGVLTNDGHGVFCTTTKEYGDFELMLEWKMASPGTDSGIYLRGCPQVQIWDPANKRQHQYGAQLGSGGLWNNNPGTPGKDPLVKADKPVGEWNQLCVRLVEDRATVHLNDQLVVDNAVMNNFWNRKRKLYKRGPIQLQTHGGEMQFRNIYIRELNGSNKNDTHKIGANEDDARQGSKSQANQFGDYKRSIPGTKIHFEMVAINGGTFTMGSSDGTDDERPKLQVQVESFWMGKHEVTWAEYQQFMQLCSVFEKFDDNDIRPLNDANRLDAITAPSKLYDPSFTYETGDHPQQPAISMTQYAARQYTKWLSLLTGQFYRLPSEAEWEYACRAGTTTAYSFGEDPTQLPDYAWSYKDAEDSYQTSQVGKLKPNPWGLHDMHGNVWEWTLDAYDANYYAKHAGGSIAASELINWPTRAYPHVLRGGSWYDEEASLFRSASRRGSGSDDDWKSFDPNRPKSPWWFASDDGQTVGFRIVRPKSPPRREKWNKYWDAQVETIQKSVDRRIDHEGRGKRGLVDPDLPAAIKLLSEE